MASRRKYGLSISASALMAIACGSSASHSAPDAGTSISYGDDGGMGSYAPSGDDAGFVSDSGGPLTLADAGGPGSFVGCATTTQAATLVPLDLYFIIDTSGSMDDLVTAGQSKWSSVVAAMTAFVDDPASAGIGMGLQYFPLPAAGVPAACTSSTQCGTSGPCLLAICSGVQETTPCTTSGDCPRGSTCEAIGQCANDHNYLCPDPGAADCGADPNGFALGACNVIASSTCAFGDSCTAQDYETPAVAIAPLPGVASTVIASLAAHEPEGNTPTSAALQGAIDQASAHATANRGHSVVTVLATDGIPDECMPSVADVAQIAAAGVAATPSIKTFVIGVFTPDDAPSGTAALDEIAASGGTTTPFIIQTSTQNVEQQFSAALTAIRGAALPCSYQVPSPEGGTPDFGKLNVQYTPASGAASTIAYVESAGRCDPQKGGWYYDADPAEGGVPSEILVCPATCSVFKGDGAGSVDIVLGCQTRLM
jgi:hypothetical protein